MEGSDGFAFAKFRNSVKVNYYAVLHIRMLSSKIIHYTHISFNIVK